MGIFGGIRRFFFQKAAHDFDANEAFRRNQLRYNALYALDPDVLVRHLSAFERGDICGLERVLDEFELREDKMMIGAFKMAAAVSSKPWEVRIRKGEEENPRAKVHQERLTKFWNRIETTDAFCRNRKGGIRLLVKQMMSAQSRVYSVHDICWKVNGDGTLSATFTHVPAWCFENRTGRLRYIRNDGQTQGEEMRDGEWLVTVGEGVGIPSAILAMAKRLSWNDWLLFSEKCGMPVIIGKTAAQRGTPAWDQLARAIRAVAPKTGLVADAGSDLSAVSMGSGTGKDTYRELVDTVDRAISALYRGGDLATMSSGQDAAGVNAQDGESELMDGDGCAMVSETLRDQVEKFVIRFECGDFEPLAEIVINPPAETEDVEREMKIDNHLAGLGVKLSKSDALARYGRTEATDVNDALEAPKPAAPGGLGGFANERPGAPSLQTALPSFKTPSRKPDGQGEGETVPALLGPFLRALQGDCKMISEEVEELLKDPTPEKAKELLAKIPDLVPEDPALAPLLAEEMAKAFGDAFTKACAPSTPDDTDLANSIDANGNKHAEKGSGNGGQFVSKDDSSSGTPSETTEKSDDTKKEVPKNAETGYTAEHRAKIGQDGDYKSLGLPSLRDITPDEPRAEGKTKIADAKKRIAAGETVKSPLGDELTIDKRTTEHWKLTNKSDADITDRLQHLDEAETTIAKPHEIWRGGGKHKGTSYIRVVKSPSGRYVLNVAEMKDGIVSWHTNETHYDFWRNGTLLYVR